MKISVIVTTFNRKHLLPETLDAILTQTFRDFEIIIVDNDSEDGTDKIAQEYIKRDTRIRYFRNPNGGVVAKNVNFGLKQVRGQYVAFCDDDDIWLPEKLEKEVKVLDLNSDIGLVCTNALKFNQEIDLGIFFEQSFTDFDFSFLGLLLGNRIIKSSVLVRKVALDNIGDFAEDPDICPADDYQMWLRMMGAGVKTYYLNEALIKYRVHSNTYSYQRIWDKWNLRVYKSINNIINDSLSSREQRLFETICNNLNYKIKFEEYNHVLLKYMKTGEPFLSKVEQKHKHGKNIVIYGAGELGTIIAQELLKRKCYVKCFIDKFCNKLELLGIPIFQDRQEADLDNAILIIAVGYDGENIVNQYCHFKNIEIAKLFD